MTRRIGVRPTPFEDRQINYMVSHSVPTNEIARILDRSGTFIRDRKRVLGLAIKPVPGKWMAVEFATLANLAAQKFSARQIARRLPGRTIEAIRKVARINGIKLIPPRSKGQKRKPTQTHRKKDVPKQAKLRLEVIIRRAKFDVVQIGQDRYRALTRIVDGYELLYLINQRRKVSGYRPFLVQTGAAR